VVVVVVPFFTKLTNDFIGESDCCKARSSQGDHRFLASPLSLGMPESMVGGRIHGHRARGRSWFHRLGAVKSRTTVSPFTTKPPAASPG
jgi:hypothetical protein